jgi:hypothetical protein
MNMILSCVSAYVCACVRVCVSHNLADWPAIIWSGCDALLLLTRINWPIKILPVCASMSQTGQQIRSDYNALLQLTSLPQGILREMAASNVSAPVRMSLHFSSHPDFRQLKLHSCCFNGLHISNPRVPFDLSASFPNIICYGGGSEMLAEHRRVYSLCLCLLVPIFWYLLLLIPITAFCYDIFTNHMVATLKCELSTDVCTSCTFVYWYLTLVPIINDTYYCVLL